MNQEKKNRPGEITICIQISESDGTTEELLKAAEQMIRGGAGMIRLKEEKSASEELKKGLETLAERYGILLADGEEEPGRKLLLLEEGSMGPEDAAELSEMNEEGITLRCRASSETLTEETARLADLVHRALNGTGYKAAVFDYDGTILDSMPMWRTTASRFASKLGVEVEEDFDEKMKYLSLEESAAIFREYGAEGTDEEIVEQVMDLVMESYRDILQPKPGVIEVLKDLEAQGIRMSIATQTPSRMIYAANKRLGLDRFFETVYSCSEWNTQKREADIYYLAAASLGAAPCETLVFEDIVYAAETADRAGFTVMGIYDESSKDDQERIAKSCRLFLDSYRDWPGMGSLTEDKEEEKQ